MSILSDEEKRELIMKMLMSKKLVKIIKKPNDTGEILVEPEKLTVSEVKEKTGWNEKEIREIFEQLSKDKLVIFDGESITHKIDSLLK